MRAAETTPMEWHVAPGVGIPSDVVAAAARGVPIVAHIRTDQPIDGWAAELLDECADVVRYGT